jgi:hypothetical protein
MVLQNLFYQLDPVEQIIQHGKVDGKPAAGIIIYWVFNFIRV